MAARTADDLELKYASYECFILGLSLLSILNIFFIWLLPVPETREVVWLVDVWLTPVFLFDFCFRLFTAPTKRGYFLHQFGWVDLAGSFPFPVLRLARLVRMVHVIRSLYGVGPIRLWRTIARDRAGSTLLTVLFLTIVLLELASASILSIELGVSNANIRTSSDALWWSYQTVTTVGYGDRYPVTNPGRMVGVVTLTLGVGLFGALTGFLANAFLRQPTQGGNDSQEDLKTELAEIRRELRSLQERGEGSTAAPPPEDS